MKLAFAALLLLGSLLETLAITTIDPTSRYAYGANIGWIDWRGETNNGAVIGEYVCSGFIYAANVGWINLGNGSPANGIQYQNLSETDFGVNQDGLGNLRGLAYGANIGWINFESNGAPRLDLKTGQMTGFAYSANCGWISLSNASAVVQTDFIAPAPLGTNGLPIPWMLTYFGTTNVNASADPDNDGMSNLQEYLAGTNPTNSSDNLRITDFSSLLGGSPATVTFSSTPTRCYFIQESLSLSSSTFFDSGLGQFTPDSGSSTVRNIPGTNAAARFYRVQAVRPLTP